MNPSLLTGYHEAPLQGRDRRHVLYDARLKDAAERRLRVVIHSVRADCTPEDLADDLPPLAAVSIVLRASMFRHRGRAVHLISVALGARGRELTSKL